MIEQLINEEKYEQALQLLKNLDDELSLYQTLLCLYGLKMYEKVIINAKDALKKANKKYYDIIKLLISSLVNIEDDEQALKILEDELTMPYIPYKYVDFFNSTYEGIKKKKALNSKQTNLYSAISNEELSTILIVGDNKDVVVNALCELKNRNIRLFLPLIRSLLKDVKRPRFIKVLILEILVEQGINEEFEFISENERIQVNPSTLEVIVNDYVYGLFLKAFDNILLNKNPTLKEYCLDVLAGYLGSIYPISVDEYEVNLIAGAIHLYVLSITNDQSDENQIASLYQQDVSKLILMKDVIVNNVNSF